VWDCHGAGFAEINFGCNNAGPAAINQGANTLSLSASAAPVPDIVALAASGDPGYVDIPGATGTGFFAVATVNLGVDATITAAANTGAANLPVTLFVCQTTRQAAPAWRRQRRAQRQASSPRRPLPLVSS
jgi:hypothetical protein